MRKNILFKYVFLGIPLVSGILLFSFGIINLFSSLLLFLGGYVFVKNALDYRKVRKNTGVNLTKKEIEPIKVNVKKIDHSKKVYVKPMNVENIVGLKRTRRYSRVRRIR